ncbi:MAG TPA: thioredoxin family protein [Candidatus Kapabacteria bacterium]|nr:thioredoxin family protein [Candidatus Kapabacteria bacterium]
MKIVFSTLLCIMVGSMIAQSQNRRDDENEEKLNQDSLMLVGRFTFDNWQKEMNWQLDTDYHIDNLKIIELDNLIAKNNISFIIFAGSWCPDSRSELPKIIELFKEANISDNKYELLGVDRMKFEPSGKYLQYKIERVPTLIVLKDGKEIGRIIEYPQKEWIEDILEIIKQH